MIFTVGLRGHLISTGNHLLGCFQPLVCVGRQHYRVFGTVIQLSSPNILLKDQKCNLSFASFYIFWYVSQMFWLIMCFINTIKWFSQTRLMYSNDCNTFLSPAVRLSQQLAGNVGKQPTNHTTVWSGGCISKGRSGCWGCWAGEPANAEVPSFLCKGSYNSDVWIVVLLSSFLIQQV